MNPQVNSRIRHKQRPENSRDINIKVFPAQKDERENNHRESIGSMSGVETIDPSFIVPADGKVSTAELYPLPGPTTGHWPGS
jgi:hypothetical protein